MNGQDKSKIIVRVIAGILLATMVLAGAGTLMYYLFN